MDLRTDSVNDILEHYGVKRRSGRYPWGSGKRPYQNSEKSSGTYALTTSLEKEIRKDNIKSFMDFIVSQTFPGYVAISIRDAMRTEKAKKIANDRTDYTEIEGPIEKLKDLRRIDPATSTDYNLKNVNPNKGAMGTEMNCQYCTIAMDMRKRGYDVRARKRPIGDTDQWLKSIYKGVELNHPDPESCKTKDNENYSQRSNRVYNLLCNDIESNGNGSRGYLSMVFRFGGGHAIYWEVENDRVNFYDSQHGTKGTKLDKLFAMADPNGYTWARLDNVNPTSKVTECVISVGKENKR